MMQHLDESQMALAQAAADLAVAQALKALEGRLRHPLTLNYAQAAEILGVSGQTVANYVASGRLQLNRAGRLSTDQVYQLAETKI